ncbi:hypothetical protein LTR37_001569 [Vermiconidia calcicola]|uniref:Uncharacterized protein n=1 Tax=Vermiconidia calcicola TaxID=1690605 RepID=A0ACC3NVM8_9PEZI|nr:hypothetical protein LTR37_001569 [Vermiconidia calcicola]
MTLPRHPREQLGFFPTLIKQHSSETNNLFFSKLNSHRPPKKQNSKLHSQRTDPHTHVETKHPQHPHIMSQIIAADMNVEFDTTDPAETANFLIQQDAGRTKDHPVFVHVIRENPGTTFANGFITAVENEVKKVRPRQDVFIVKQPYTYPILELPAHAERAKNQANEAVGLKGIERRFGADACGGCGKEATDSGEALMKCSGCTVRLYCSKDCQKMSWKVHKKVCWML